MLFDSAMLPFTAALLLMAVIGLLQATGLAADADLDVPDGGLLDWLGVGRVPFLILLVVALGVFGVSGAAIQHATAAITGSWLPIVVAAPAALATALPLTALAARMLGRVLPRDESTAFGRDYLVGLTGTVITGRARADSPARVRVSDPHGQPHFVLVEPDDARASFEEGDEVLLVRRTGDTFRAVFHASPRLSNWTVK